MTQPSTLLMSAISCYHVSIITGAARTRLIRNLSPIISCSAASLGSALPILIIYSYSVSQAIRWQRNALKKGWSAIVDFHQKKGGKLNSNNPQVIATVKRRIWIWKIAKEDRVAGDPCPDSSAARVCSPINILRCVSQTPEFFSRVMHVVINTA